MQDQLNHDDDKVLHNNEKAILKGDIINIAEHNCKLCKKKKLRNAYKGSP